MKYDSRVFLEMAMKYFNDTPCDLVQASEKLWGAASYAVQSYCLGLGANLASHNSMRYFVKLVTAECHTAEQAIKLNYAWDVAQE